MKIFAVSELAIGLLAMAIAPAFAAATDTDKSGPDQSTQDADQIRQDVNTQAAIIGAVDAMKAGDADQAAAQNRYTETVDAAKAEHEAAIGKCEALSGDAKAACKKPADEAFNLAKSEAQKALEAHISAQP